MIHVFPDTTVFRDDPMRRKAPFKVVERLAELGKIVVHISEVSRREFVTQQEQHFDDQLAALKKTLKELNKKIPDPELLAGLTKEIDTLQAKRGHVEKEFSDWLSQFRVQVHAVADHHGASVIEKYFTGQPPFSQLKSRKDFPDAFIWEAAADVAKTVGRLNVVTGDNPVSGRIEEISDVTAHKSLHEFVASASLEALLQQTENLDAIMGFLAADAKKTAQYISSPIVDRLAESSHTPFPEEAEATILDVGDLRDLEVNTHAVEDYGDGLFVLPFSAKTECLIQYYMLKADYWGLEPEVTPRSVTDWNDHVFQVEEYYDLAVTGTLGFQLEPGALDGRIRRMKEIAQIFAVADVSVEEILSVEFVDEAMAV